MTEIIANTVNLSVHGLVRNKYNFDRVTLQIYLTKDLTNSYQVAMWTIYFALNHVLYQY